MGLTHILKHTNWALCVMLFTKGHVHTYAIVPADIKLYFCCAARGAGMRSDVCSMQSQ